MASVVPTNPILPTRDYCQRIRQPNSGLTSLFLRINNFTPKAMDPSPRDAPQLMNNTQTSWLYARGWFLALGQYSDWQRRALRALPSSRDQLGSHPLGLITSPGEVDFPSNDERNSREPREVPPIALEVKSANDIPPNSQKFHWTTTFKGEVIPQPVIQHGANCLAPGLVKIIMKPTLKVNMAWSEEAYQPSLGWEELYHEQQTTFLKAWMFLNRVFFAGNPKYYKSREPNQGAGSQFSP